MWYDAALLGSTFSLIYSEQLCPCKDVYCECVCSKQIFEIVLDILIRLSGYLMKLSFHQNIYRSGFLVPQRPQWSSGSPSVDYW